MKALIAVVALLVLMVAGLGLFLFSGARSERAQTAYDAAPASSAAALASASSAAAERADLLGRLDTLAQDIADLHAEIAELKAGAARTPAVAPAKVEDESSVAFAALHKEAILKVIEQDREEQKRKRDEEQRQREMENLLARADRTAKKFGLNADQQKALADVYVLERQKIEDLRTRMCDQGGFQDNPEGVREAFREMRDWRLNELTTRLGSDLAQKINETDVQNLRGAMGGGGPGGGGGGRRANRQQGGGEGGGQGGNGGG